MNKNLSQLVSEATSSENKLIDAPRTFSSEPELKDFYERFGYVTIKNLIPNSLIQDINQDLLSIFSPYATDENNTVDSAVLQLDKTNKPKLYELHIASSKTLSFKATSAFFKNVLRKISGSDAPVLEMASGWLLSIPQDKRLVYDFHQESNYMKGFSDIFNFHYPLFRTSTTENGTMSILPTSHLWGTLPFEKRRTTQHSYTDLIPKDIETITKKLPELHCYLELGDCVIFHKNLIHRSNFNATNLCRPVGISRLTQSLVGDWIRSTPESL